MPVICSYIYTMYCMSAQINSLIIDLLLEGKSMMWEFFCYFRSKPHDFNQPHLSTDCYNDFSLSLCIPTKVCLFVWWFVFPREKCSRKAFNVCLH